MALFFITNRWKHPLLLPGILVATVLLFLAAIQLAGIDSATAMTRGWILGPFDENARLWPIWPGWSGQCSCNNGDSSA